MTRDAVIGAALLFAVSIVVRIVPAFVKVNLSEQRSEEIRTLLPVAVLINLMAYCVVSESHQNLTAALVGFGTLAVLILIQRVNLLLMIVLASAAYLAAR
jgi:hypothetical protein